MDGRRSRRLPVISQLTVAWMAFGAAGVGTIAYALIWGADALRPEKVALPVGEVETIARPEPASPPTHSVLASTEERLPPSGPVNVIEPVDEPFSVEGEDGLSIEPSYTDNLVEGDPIDIVITVDGEPARQPGERVLSPALASLEKAPRRFSIPGADPALLQRTPLGAIPKVAKDGRRALKFYAAPFEGDAKAPKVALIVGGLGLNPTLTERAIEELPPFVTLSFAPYAKNLDRWTAEARAAGHEIVLELPMEGYGGGVDALGPAALLTMRSEADNLQRLDWLLSRFGAYVGVTNYFGGKFSADTKSITPVVKRLNDLGLAYFDDTGAAKAAAEDARHVATIDRMVASKGAQEDPEDVLRDLAALQKAAEKDGAVIGKTYAFDAVIDAIIEWNEGLEEEGVVLAPASTVLQTRARRG